MGHDNVKEMWRQLKGEPQYEDTEKVMGKENLLNYPLVEDTKLYPIPYMLTSKKNHRKTPPGRNELSGLLVSEFQTRA